MAGSPAELCGVVPPHKLALLRANRRIGARRRAARRSRNGTLRRRKTCGGGADQGCGDRLRSFGNPGQRDCAWVGTHTHDRALAQRPANAREGPRRLTHPAGGGARGCCWPRALSRIRPGKRHHRGCLPCRRCTYRSLSNTPTLGRGESAMKKQVVIIGGGFGGLRAARALKAAPVEVTLIDRRNYHLFQPLLYQVATGSLSPGDVAAPLRSVFSRQKNTRVLLGDVVDVDPASRRVVLADGAEFPYDALIIAAGSQSSYYGHDNWRQWAPSLKSVEEATTIRHKIFYAFEVAERLSHPGQRRAWLTFVIVGAGATGVELAGALAAIARRTLKNDFRSIHPEEARIILMDGLPRVLPPFPEDLSRKAERSLAKLGVQVMTGVMVKDIDKEGVVFAGPNNAGTERLEARTVI